MVRTISKSKQIPTVIELIEGLQARFIQALEAMAQRQGEPTRFCKIEWLRDEGRHGGGWRYEAPRGPVFNAGSANVSHVHYDDEPDRSLQSATALSAIMHPHNPYAPSIHIHLSWTELKSGGGYWRIMADLNPSILVEDFQKRFTEVIYQFGQPHVAEALADGDKYFFIPALNRHRGVVHFYLEDYRGEGFESSFAYCDRLFTNIIDLYPAFVSEAMCSHPNPSPEDWRKQLEYHSLYFLQVLTLDRGTTAGLMVHQQNDLGIMGSLPAAVDRILLQSWLTKHDHPKSDLLRSLIDVMPQSSTVAEIGSDQKLSLARSVRNFYTQYPQALAFQASGSKIPKTADHHGRPGS